MTQSTEDTEYLLALLSSLLTVPTPDQNVLLDTLVGSNGDVERAAQIINNGESVAGPSRPKKPSSAKLDNWLQSDRNKQTSNKRPRSQSPPSTSSKPPSKKRHISAPLKSVSRIGKNNVSMTKPSSNVGSPSKKNTVTNEEFMSMFRPPNSETDPSSKSMPLKLPPLTLGTPQLVAQHTPCTMHTSVLPPELACRLFYTMIYLSHTWGRNEWFLFDRMVESPHRTSFFVRYQNSDGSNPSGMDEAAEFWYNGRRTGPSPPFPPEMEEACEYIERIVNSEMRKRHRFPLEWGGEPPTNSDGDKMGEENIVWRANVAASNCYEGGKESVGLHTDKLTYLGPYPTIASLSLGTTRIFRLREVIPTEEKSGRAARTYNIPLAHNSLTIMHASCQETFKHAIPPQRTIDAFHPTYPPPPHLSSFFSKHSPTNPCTSSDNDLSSKTETPCIIAPTLANAESDPYSTKSIPPKASIQPFNSRINITFRFFRPDYSPSRTPKCKCGVPCILRPDMKNRYDVVGDGKKAQVAKYWWACNGGAQNDGKGCGMWMVMDAKKEGRGPFAGDV
ncbi:hypothetical protein C8Q75DRAFT_801649 [Abortiporus biennis]|nr:hypothetical protein C8Q75DRAFT_801649 [Abortiporus biennis]